MLEEQKYDQELQSALKELEARGNGFKVAFVFSFFNRSSTVRDLNISYF